MGDFFFFTKMLVYTFVLSLLLQTRISGTTLESRLVTITHKSEIARQARLVSEGVLRFIGTHTVYGSGQELSQKLPGMTKKVTKKVKKKMKESLKETEKKIEDHINRANKEDSIFL